VDATRDAGPFVHARPVFISSGDPEVVGHWIECSWHVSRRPYSKSCFIVLREKGKLETDKYPRTNFGLLNGGFSIPTADEDNTEGPNWTYFIRLCKTLFQ